MTSRGFTLLEVLVALTILGLAIVTLMQLSSQGLRLLHLADDYQRAVLVADRIVRTSDALQEGVDTGRAGPFEWERRVGLVAVPEELTPGSGPRPRLFTLSVVVRWGSNRTLELASLRTVAETPGR
jgi:prepilin-type N-terminal cleavage/methylation domain-containing protein